MLDTLSNEKIMQPKLISQNDDIDVSKGTHLRQ